MDTPFKSLIGKTIWFGILVTLMLPVSAHTQSLLSASQAGISTLNVVAQTDAVIPGNVLELAITIDLAPKWHTYWQYPGPTGKAPELNWNESDMIPIPPLRFPEPERIPFAGQTSYGYHNSVTFLATVAVPSSYMGERFILNGTLTYLVCKDACLIKEETFVIDLPVAQNAALISVNPEYEHAVKNWDMSGPSQLVIWSVLLAFLGGLLLNIMPCVLPVLSIKVLHIVQQPAHRRMSDAALFNAGVISSLLALFGVLSALKAGGTQLGWGFQLQSPILVSVLMALFFGFALNLFGAFEVVLPQFIARVSSRFGGFGSGSFWSGVFTTIVATPCTAPFMGAAVGIALTQSIAIGVLIFIALGVGLAFPLTLISVVPFFSRLIPKPGTWMVQAKLVLGIPLLLSAFWLLWVLGKQVPFENFVMATVGLGLLGIYLVRLGSFQRRSPLLPLSLSATKLAVITVIVAGFLLVPHLVYHGGLWPGAQTQWQDYSPELVHELELSGTPYFIDFTAAWCVTCQYNKRRTLNRSDVRAAFSAANITLIRADWTNRNATIARALSRFDRATVPLYVFYSGSGAPVILPTLISPDDIFVLTSAQAKP
ncbi:MAG: thioredoxin family protein [bacterium]|nr:thioredoxin family protein [bacterium]